VRRLLCLLVGWFGTLSLWGLAEDEGHVWEPSTYLVVEEEWARCARCGQTLKQGWRRMG
jgi:hypothetical protein